MRTEKKDDCISIYLPKRITSENAAAFEEKLDSIIKEFPEERYEFNAEELEMISSMGLRVLMKAIRSHNEKIPVINVSGDVYSVFEVTGFTELMDVRMKMRRLSIDGCQLIGEGRSSRVYRLNEDTIIKCYEPGVPERMIRKELELSRKAFVMGLPTAIPFDMVRVGEGYGIVFELIAAETLGNHVVRHPEELKDITRKFSELLKKIHTTHTNMSSGFMSVKSLWFYWLEGMRPHFTEDEYALMTEMLDEVPERDTVVHCDYHENNVLYQNGKLILIDLIDMGYGHPVFDLACMAFRSHVSLIPGRKAHHSFSPEEMNRFWKMELHYYFNIDETDSVDDLIEMLSAFGYLRSALFPMKHPEISDELRTLHIDDARRNLLCRPKWAMEQVKKLDRYF
jgi:uncharacterized protein (TIGR02172 family)